mmetsp:Transcript_5990/g.20421  ORF Transcript_5990/g.20421 Transcript_5990/m.20421 type:complete len:258 (-) Transcript_5990:2038-2811(-)
MGANQLQLLLPKEQPPRRPVELLRVVKLVRRRDALEVRDVRDGPHWKAAVDKPVVHKHVSPPERRDAKPQPKRAAAHDPRGKKAVQDEPDGRSGVNDGKDVVGLERALARYVVGFMPLDPGSVLPKPKVGEVPPPVVPQILMSPPRKHLHPERGASRQRQRGEHLREYARCLITVDGEARVRRPERQPANARGRSNRGEEVCHPLALLVRGLLRELLLGAHHLLLCGSTRGVGVGVVADLLDHHVGSLQLRDALLCG